MDKTLTNSEMRGQSRGLISTLPLVSSKIPEKENLEIPTYLQDTYYWAYLNPRNVHLLDRELVVKVILWGQHRRLRQSAFAEILSGQSVLQPAHVYGEFSPALAQHLGSEGRLDVIDVVPIQVANCRHKLEPFPQATAHHANAARPGNGIYDAVCCYFLLHELPDEYKCSVVDALLERVDVGGKVIFVDYHKPHWAHPLKPLTSFVFDTLEPFAKGLWRNEINDLSVHSDQFIWRKETFFGGLFQKVVAERVQNKIQ